MKIYVYVCKVKRDAVFASLLTLCWVERLSGYSQLGIQSSNGIMTSGYSQHGVWPNNGLMTSGCVVSLPFFFFFFVIVATALKLAKG